MPYKTHRNDNRHQSSMVYQLTDQDLLQLYALFTPAEIIKEFKPWRVRCEKSIYNLIRKCKLDRPLQARKFLVRIILAACSEEVGFDDWEKLVKKLGYVKPKLLFVCGRRLIRMNLCGVKDGLDYCYTLPRM